MAQRFTASEQASLEKLLVKAGDNQIPGTWLLEGSVPASRLQEADPIFFAHPAAGITQAFLDVTGGLPGRVALLETDGAAVLARVVILEGDVAALDSRVTVLEQPLTLAELPQLSGAVCVPLLDTAADKGIPAPGAEYQLRTGSESYDPEGWHVLTTPVSGASEFPSPPATALYCSQFTLPRAGVYMFVLSIRFNAMVAATDYTEAFFRVDGALAAKGVEAAPNAAGVAQATCVYMDVFAAGAVVTPHYRASVAASNAARLVDGTRLHGVYLGRAS